MLPEGWKYTEVQEVAKVIRGASPRPQGDPRFYGGLVPRLMVADVTRDGKYVSPKIDFLTEEGAKRSRPMPKGTLTIVCSGVVGIPSILAVDACIHDGFLALEDVKKGFLIDYGYYVFSNMQKDFDTSATHGGIFTNLTTTILKEFVFLLPPLPEQKKIAAILSTWDRAIEVTEKLLANSQQQKKALMQQLLTGKKRLPRFTGDWETKRIQNLADRITHSGADSNLKILMISSTLGFVEQSKKYSRFMAGESLKNYISIERGDFAYNKGNSKSYQFGCVFELSEFDEGLVPNIYVCFKIKGAYDRSFYKNLFLFDFLKPQLRAVVNSGVRNNGLLNIRSSQFMEMFVPVPSLSEQKAIASVLTKADEEVTLLKSDLIRLRQEKKALMQQLLTGKRRVKIEADAG